VLRPQLAPAETQILTLATAVAAADTINEAGGLSAGIKWPNDLVIDGKKVCGILVEMSSEADRVNYVVIGTGINYSQKAEDFPPEIRDRAISMKAASEGQGRPEGTTGFDRLSVVRLFLKKLDDIVKLVLSNDNKKIIEMWRARSVTLGKKVCFKLRDSGYTGTAIDITGDGRLIVDCDDGIRRELLSGEVSVRGVYGYF